MTLTTKQIARAYDVLNQGVVCLDDNLRQGVLVYVESLLVQHNIPRDNYLALEDLRCDYPYVRMGSYMPIDFFALVGGHNLATSCNDVNFRPVSIKLCTVSLKGGRMATHQWELVDTYRDDQIIHAIEILLEILSDESYFDYCKVCNQVRPTGLLDREQVCDCCCAELLEVA